MQARRSYHVLPLSLRLCLLLLLLSSSQVHPSSVPMPHVDGALLAELVKNASAEVTKQLEDAERALLASPGGRQTPGSPGWFAAASARIKIVAKNISTIALVAEEVSRQMAHRFGLSKEQINLALPTLKVRGTLLGDSCPLEVDFPCQPRKYRAYSGYCNNVQNPRWANSNTRYLRYLPSDYGDGVSSLRSARDGSLLPSARRVSSVVHGDRAVYHDYVTSIVASWTQMVAHDVAHTAQAVGNNGQRLQCCGEHRHPECAGIPVEPRDPVYEAINVSCLEYVRSCMGPRTGCMLGPREQVNQVTSYLDASSIYGSSKEEADDLRSFISGLLQTQYFWGSKELLAPDDDIQDCKVNNSHRCFKTGDIRVNENVGLTLLLTIWMREHNRIARALRTINIHWNDETLFQETRRIVAAEIQQITYNEFLPILLGQTLINRHDLHLEPSSYYNGYDINANSGIANALGSAILHLSYSLMPSTFDLYNTTNRPIGRRNLSATYYAPFDLYDRRTFDQLLIGLTSQKAQKMDEYISQELTSRLFSDSSGIGLDAAAQTIQQGRDHGIPGYTRWREECGLATVSSFDELQDVMDLETVRKFKTVYIHVDDIDLYSGGLAERVRKGALVGPTFGCLIARQFSAIRKGDRYWYENDIPPSSFTKEQLSEIRKVTLARILCDNANDLHWIQPQAMLQADPFLNSFMECSSDMIKSIDLQKWRSDNLFVMPDNILQDSVERARRQVEERKNHEQQSFYKNYGVASEKSPIGIHLGFVRPKRESISISNTSLVLQFASQRFVSSFLQGQLKDVESDLSPPRGIGELMKILPNIDVSEFVDIERNFECDEQTLPCDHTSRFRTYTGLCNNLNNPTQGKSFKAFQRLLPPTYEDNLSEPRHLSVTGSPLPSARLVSISIHSDTSSPHVRYTLMMMQFGQFIDHDLSHTPVHTGFEGAILDCSRCDSREKVHPECYPIPIPASDPYFPSSGGSGGSRCLSLIRSLPGQLTMGAREQINQVTAFVDSSHVYGSDVCDAKKLRSLWGGRLNSTRHSGGGKELLPQTSQNKECKARSGLCFDAGDKRASEQIGLATMHTLYMREHNRIVGQLAAINPHWDDEQLYQNGRRILGAINQHLVYGEFLPRVLGWNAVHHYELEVLPAGYSDSYDATCNPAIFNEFSTAAFRFGHSLIKPFLQRMDQFFNLSPEKMHLRHKFFNPDDLYKVGMIDELMRGLSTSTMETLDQFITTEVTNHLFEDSKIPFSGLDLIALNLQRGREHAIATYNQMRVHCNMSQALAFEDLVSEIPVSTIEKLKSIYRHVDDIDLFTGGLSETANPGGLVGPTFACIIGSQFRSLRKCDRFWYETSNPLLRFTEAQLMEIRKATLAKVICENSDSIDSLQQSIFDLPDGFRNPRVPCRSLPSVNLGLWKDNNAICVKGESKFALGTSSRISPCVMCTCTTEGPLCQSVKITNCFELAASFPSENILADPICKVQCAFVFRASPQVNEDGNYILSISS